MDTGNEPPTPVPDPGTTNLHPQDSRGRFTHSQIAADKAAHALRLRTANPKMTYQQIADEVGYSNKGDAWRAIQDAREAVKRAAGAELVAAEAQQLDDLFAAALEVLDRDHVVVSHGRIVCDNDGNPLLDDGPKLAAIREMRAIRESYRKLYGADQPTQVAVSGAVRYEVVGVDPADLT
jgi:hypothetical protein